MAEDLVGEAWWQFRGDDSKLRAEVTKTENEIKQSATRGGTAFSGAMQAATGKVKNYFSDLGNVAKGFLGIFAAQQVVTFFGDAVNAAAEFNDSLDASRVIFGEQFVPSMEAWGEAAARNFGASKQEAISAANVIATLGKSAGLTGQELIGFSQEMVQLGGDLASMFGGTTQDAITAVGAALRGESEPIRRYGVLLDDATLRQKAFEMGLISTTKNALTPQQRVLAAQASILEQTTDAQGNFADTSEGMANTQRELRAELENVSIEIGEKLIPVMLALATFVKDVLVPALSWLTEWVIGPIAKGIENIGTSFRTAAGDIYFFRMNFGEEGSKVHRLADEMGSEFDELKDRIRDRMLESGESWDGFAAAFAAVEEEVRDGAKGVEGSMADISTASAELMGNMYQSIISGAVPIEREFERIAKMPGSMMRAEYADIRAAAYQSQVEFAKGLLDAQNEPQVAMDALVQYQEETLSTSAQIARLMGMLHSEELAAGLIDSRPLVNAQAQATRAAIVNQLSNLGAYSWGWETGTAYAAGMNAAYGYVLDAAGNLAVAARGQIGIESEPRDPSSPLRGITKWGGNLVRTYVDDVLRHVPLARSAFADLAAAMAPPVAGLAGVAAQSFGGAAPWRSEAAIGGPTSAAPGSLGGGETHLHAHLEVSGRPDIVETEEELARLFGRVVGVGLQPLAGGDVGG